MLDKPATPKPTLLRSREIARRNGLRYVYTGNVHDKASGSTYCHECDQILVGRDWYELSDWNLTDDGHCTKCGAKCPGVFDGPPGHWGSKRLPVRLAGTA
jgi:pyruvate formate lyase activating enzyme